MRNVSFKLVLTLKTYMHALLLGVQETKFCSNAVKSAAWLPKEQYFMI